MRLDTVLRFRGDAAHSAFRVKVWYDAQCRVSDIFGAPYSPYRCGCNQNIKVAEGINVAFKGWTATGSTTNGPVVSIIHFRM